MTGTAGVDATALSALVAAENAVLYGLSAAGGRLAVIVPNVGQGALIAAAYESHELRYVAVVTALQKLGVSPPAAAPAYALPALTTAAVVLRFAGQLEESTARAYRTALTTLQSAALRQLAVTAVVDAGEREAQLLLAAGVPVTAATNALPGTT